MKTNAQKIKENYLEYAALNRKLRKYFTVSIKEWNFDQLMDRDEAVASIDDFGCLSLTERTLNVEDALRLRDWLTEVFDSNAER